MLIGVSDWVKAWGALAFVAGDRRGDRLPLRAAQGMPSRRWHAFPCCARAASRSAGRSTDTARFASTLAILTRSGVPLGGAGDRRRGDRQPDHPQRSGQGAQKVREGASLTRSLEATGQFPPMMLHMIASGERSGELDQMLATHRATRENDLAAQIGLMVGLFGEPFMLIFHGRGGAGHRPYPSSDPLPNQLVG